MVAAGLATRCEVQFAYAIGYPDPVSMNINTFRHKHVSRRSNRARGESAPSFKPAEIIQQLNLLRPIYSKTTNYGHFGKGRPRYTWEKTDKAARCEEGSEVGFRGSRVSGFRILGYDVFKTSGGRDFDSRTSECGNGERVPEP